MDLSYLGERARMRRTSWTKFPSTNLRHGTKPTISADLKERIVEWVAATQRVSLLVTCAEIMKRANMIYDATHQHSRANPSKQLLSSWYSRFLGRHLVLTSRTVHSIGMKRYWECVGGWCCFA